jgi:FkbM family methyltransferase
MLTPRSLLQLAKPPYFFQPFQVLKRLRLEFFWRSRRDASVVLPWGLSIKIDPHEAIGYTIASQGLYEIALTESLWRLTEPGDLAIDAGANIGYTASILGIRVGAGGRVFCFEPHPLVFNSLKANVDIWKKDRRCGSFELHQEALGAASGKASLHTSDWFRTNRGTAWISGATEANPDFRTIEVPIRNLDSLFGQVAAIGVLKMDVQGHELSVLHGAARLLDRHALRDIIFEEEGAFPSPAHNFLKSHGYFIFGIQEAFTGVRYLPDAQPVFDPVTGPVPNYLATIEPERAMARLSPGMWQSFGLARLIASHL